MNTEQKICWNVTIDSSLEELKRLNQTRAEFEAVINHSVGYTGESYLMAPDGKVLWSRWEQKRK